MKKEYFTNNNLKSLEYFLVAFATLSIALLIGIISTGVANNELINIFSYISAVVFVLCALAYLLLFNLPQYYFYIESNLLYLPISSFFKWTGEHLKFELKNIKSVHIEPSYEDGYDLVILVKSPNNVRTANMALGQISIENLGENTKICIFNLKKIIAGKWLSKLNNQ